MATQTAVPRTLPEIPGYDILELIKEGGMGRVYKAWNIGVERLEAIKFIAPHLLSSPEIRQRFHEEARCVGALSHRNIATLYQYGEAQGEPYLAFEYCEGGTLSGRIRGQRLSPEKIREYALALADGLAYAHNHGVIHRDIKPGNVLFHERTLKLIDFGLAELRAHTPERFRSGGSGTPPYMSPEQIRGGSGDECSDIYSLGVVLYEMAAGRRPFESGSLRELFRQITEDDPVPLASRRSDLEGWFCRLVDRMLSKDPADRPQSMDEVLEALRERREPWLRPEPAPAPLSPWKRFTGWLGTLPRRVSAPGFWRTGGAFLAVMLLIYTLALTDALESVNRFIGTLSGKAQAPPVIVVLPFESATAQEDAKNFASALDERLITELVQSGRSRASFKVVPASEVRGFDVRSCADARKRLKADFVFGGTVRKESESYWIMLALSDGSSCEQIRAEKVEVDRPRLPWLDADLRDRALKMLPERARAASIIVASAQAFSNPRAYELTLEARGQLRRYGGKAHVEAALSKLEEAVRADPKSAEAWAWLAEARVQLWRLAHDRRTLELAEEAARRAAGLNGNLAAVRLAAGRVAHERGDWERAVAEYRAAMELNPEDSEIYRFAGRACSEAGRNREAETYYRKAVEVDPGSWQAYSGLGRFLYQEKRFDEALEAYQRAAGLFDESPLVHSGMGAAYYGLGRFEEAEREFRKSIDRAPNAVAYSNLGSLLYERGRYAEAAQFFELAVALRPWDDAAWAFVGEACARVPGKAARSREAFRKAVALFHEALNINPSDAERWARLAVAKAHLGDSRGSREAIQRALQLRPGDEDLLYWGARAEARLGNVGRAVELMTKSLEEGYPRDQALRDPDLEPVRKDPRLRALLQ